MGNYCFIGFYKGVVLLAFFYFFFFFENNHRAQIIVFGRFGGPEKGL